MNRKTFLLGLCCCVLVAKAARSEQRNDEYIVGSFNVSGEELWHGYFLSDDILLVELAETGEDGYMLINHPSYSPQAEAVHRLVCERGRPDENGDQNRCKDEFPHVHINAVRHFHFTDFILASSFAKTECESLGSTVEPQFIGPQTFIDINNNPISTHSSLYNLTQGLVFNCVESSLRMNIN